MALGIASYLGLVYLVVEVRKSGFFVQVARQNENRKNSRILANFEEIRIRKELKRAAACAKIL